MNTKPVTPTLHGTIDYAFSGIQLLAPLALGLGPQMAKTYGALGLGFLGVNAFTDTPAGIRHSISFRNHQRLDLSFLAGLSLLSMVRFIRGNKKALRFHLAFLGLAVAHYVLTDYKSGSR